MAKHALILAVRNVLGVRTADLPLTGINLIAGRNGAGKSSLLEATACAVLQTARVRGITTKKAATAVVRRGAEEGVVALADAGAPVLRVRWPASEIEQLGAPLAPISRPASGIGQFIDLPPEQRMAEIFARYDAKPVREDLYQFLVQHEGTAPLRDIVVHDATEEKPAYTALDQAVDAMYRRVQESGWDAVYRTARETNTATKGRWEQAAGRKFGSRLAANFIPPLLVPGEEYVEAQHEAHVARAKKRLEDLIAAGGVADHERTLLREEADKAAQLETDLQELEAQATQIEAQMRQAVAEQAKPNAAIDFRDLIECPKCRSQLRAVRVTSGPHIGIGTVYEIVTLPTQEEQEAQAQEARAIQAKINTGRAALEENTRQKSTVAAEIAKAKRAGNRLAQAEGKPLQDEEAIAAQRTVVANAEAMLRAVQQYHECQRIYIDICRNTAFVEALEPQGVRMAVLRRKIGELNADLKKVCDLAKFEPVTVEAEDAELEIFYGDRMAKLASKSERWRTEFAFAVVFAQREGSPLLLLDELDIINNDDRAPIVMALNKLGLNALICMTAKSRDKDVPDLKRANLGATWWMENGELSPLNS